MKKRKTQEVKELRREIEILRAQLRAVNKNDISSEPLVKSVLKQTKLKQVNIEHDSQNLDILLDNKYLKTQLLRTFVLSIIAFAIITGIYFYGIENVIKILNI